MSLILFPPRNRVQEIAYQTILPHYSSKILEEYNKVHHEMGQRVLDLINKEISLLEEIKKTWNSDFEFERYLSKRGFNVSGRYMGKEFYGEYNHE